MTAEWNMINMIWGVLAFKTTDNAGRVGTIATSQSIVICKYVPYLCSQTSMLELINNVMVSSNKVLGPELEDAD